MRYLMTVLVEVDDELLAAHDGEAAPPPNDVADWYGGDLQRALEGGIAELEHEELTAIDPVYADNRKES